MSISLDNLKLLASIPIAKLTTDGDRLRPLKPGESANQEMLNKVIEDTFRSTATDPKHRFWVKLKEHAYVSPGFLAKKLGILSELQLPVEKEECHLIVLTIGTHKMEVERESLARSPSELFEHLFGGPFKEASSPEVKIELPIDVSPEAISRAIEVLLSGHLPDSLDMNEYIDLVILFHFFQANELLKAASAKIVSLKLGIGEWVTILRLPEEIIDGLIAELSDGQAKELIEQLFCLNISAQEMKDEREWAARLGKSDEVNKTHQDITRARSIFNELGATLVKNKAGQTIEIKGTDWTISMQKFVISLVNKKDIEIPTIEFIDYFEPYTNLLESLNILDPVKSSVFESVLKRCPNVLRLTWPSIIFSTESLADIGPGERVEGNNLEYLKWVPKLQELNIRSDTLDSDELKHLDKTPLLKKLNLQIAHLDQHFIPEQLRANLTIIS